MGRLDDRVAIVTGGARGTGEAIVRRFVAEGAKVLVVDLLADRGTALTTELGEQAAFFQADVTSESDWAAAADEVVARWGRLDVLVNNAAILHLCPIDRTEVVDFERVLRINAVGPFIGIKACLPALRDGGVVVVDDVERNSAFAAFGRARSDWRAVAGMADDDRAVVGVAIKGTRALGGVRVR